MANVTIMASVTKVKFSLLHVLFMANGIMQKNYDK